ncbi:MAG TPA: hypothetical protein VGD91_16135 [Trebonia sp.]
MSRGSHRPIDVRAATAADARGIAIVDVQSWQAAYQGLIADGVLAGMSVTDHERHWRERITGAPPRSDTVVLTRHAAVLGFAATGPARLLDDEGEGELHAFTSLRTLGGADTARGCTLDESPERQ